MKLNLNGKDMASGIFLMVVALAGLYLNMDHSLGSARRMGPGYMPMLVLWLQLGLGALIFLLALRGGPDDLETWMKLDFVTLAVGVASTLLIWQVMERSGFNNNYIQVGLACLVGLLLLAISPAWRPLGMVLGSFAIFGLLLEPLGLMLSIFALCIVSSFADREHTPLSVLGMSVFLCALCWFVFIYELDIRVPVWPGSY